MATTLDLGPARESRDPHDVPATTPPPATWSAGPATAIRLSLLDGFELSIDGTSAEVSPIAQRLLAFLAVQERPVLREYVLACLWNDVDNEHARTGLHAELDRLRCLDDSLVNAASSHLRLNPQVSVDLHDAIDGARALLDPGRQVIDGDFDEFLMSGDVLPGWDEDWVLIERERLRQLRLHALEALCGRLTAAGRSAEAIDAGLAAVAADPLRESAHRALIQAHFAEGNRAEAVRQCEAYREILWSSYGVMPSPRLDALMAEGLADPSPDAPGSSPRPQRRKARARSADQAPARPRPGTRRPPVDEEEAR